MLAGGGTIVYHKAKTGAVKGGHPNKRMVVERRLLAAQLPRDVEGGIPGAPF